MKRMVMIKVALGTVMALLVLNYGAHNTVAGVAAAVRQDPVKDEAAAYAAWYDAFTAKDTGKAFQLAKDYVAKFPDGKNSAYLKKYVAGTRGSLFNQAMQAKNTAEMIRLGNEALTEDPESLDYLYLLAFGLRANDLLAQPPSFSRAAQILDYTQRTLRLLESGKVPTIVDKTKWNANQSMSLLYQSIALVEEKNGNFDKATEAFQKAASLDGTVAFNFLKLGSLFQLKYQDAVKTFQAFPDADRIATAEEMKPEVKSALAELNRRADAVIEAWAHFMALTASKNDFGPTRDQVDKALTELYKFRHPDSEDGLQKLIEQYRTNSSPTTASSKP